MKFRTFKKEKVAVAGVIEALLLIALVAVILSTIQIYYVPEIMEQKESEHMDEVVNQFSLLKSTIDSQSLVGSHDSDDPIVYAPMSSTITLGSSRLPYLVSIAASGEIEILDEDETTSKIDMNDTDDLEYPFLNGIPLTSIKFKAYNYYFPENNPGQEYILEGGGIIRKQHNGEVMIVAPGMIVENHSQDGYIKIYYNLPFFTSKPGKKDDSGFNNCYVRTNYITDYSSIETLADDADDDSLRIYSEYLDAWNQALINNDMGILWEYYAPPNEYIDVSFDDIQDPQYIEITSKNKTIDVELTIIEIGVQVGPGVVN